MVEVDDPAVGSGQLQHGDLVDNVHPTVLALPPLPHELGGVLMAREFLHALSDHGKLPPARQEEHKHRAHKDNV